MSITITEVDEFTASVVVPTGGDARTAASVLGAFQALANRTKNIKGAVDSRLGTKLLSNTSFVPWQPTSAGTAPGWAVLNGTPAQSLANMVSTNIYACAFRPLDDLLVNGHTLSQARVRILPGAARSGSARTQAYVQKCAVFASGGSNDWTPIGSAVYDDGTATLQSIVISLSEVIDLTTYAYQLLVQSGLSGDTNPDRLLGGSITIT